MVWKNNKRKKISKFRGKREYRMEFELDGEGNEEEDGCRNK